jgi:Tfp pilus assembly protein PilX
MTDRATGQRLRQLQARLPNQTGIAAVIALLALALLSVMGITLVSLSLLESQISSNETDLRRAFFAAEAGIHEAMYRMRLDPGASHEGTACDPAIQSDPVAVGYVENGPPVVRATPNPDPTHTNYWKYNRYDEETDSIECSWTYSGESATGYGNYFGGNAANLNRAGRTFRSSGPAHAGALSNANLANGASYTTTVAPVVRHVGGSWQFVDHLGGSLGSSSPMYRVTSIGRARDSRKVVAAMIRRFQLNIDANLDGALTANTNVNVQSAAAIIDGSNHDCDGNSDSSVPGKWAATSPTGAEGIDTNKPENLQCDAGTGDDCKGTSPTFPPTIGELLLGPDAKPEEIQALNAYLESIKILPDQAPTTAAEFNAKGIVYINGNYAKPPDGSEGILIVHNATNNAVLGNFNTGTFKGLIVADKINKINGNAQIIGGIFGFGSAEDGVLVDDVTGTPQIKYSKCIIDKLSDTVNLPYHIVAGTWHEQ